MPVRITVVGAGAIGLTSAIAVQQQIPNCRLTVISDRVTPDTTSDVSGGMWGPHLVADTATADIIKWSSDTWSQFLEWYNSGEDWGVSLTRGVTVCDTPLPREPWAHVPFGYTDLTEEQCSQHAPGCISGFAFTTFFAEPSKFLPKLASEIMARGGTFKQQHLNSLSEACEDADLVINCSGLGARHLVPDQSVAPVRGQVVRVRAPWVSTYIADERESSFAYILPNIDCVVLGGTRGEGDWSTEEDRETTRTILARCTKLMPSLKEAEVLGVSVGLRPGRTGGVRLERGELPVGGRTVPVIHNYGHAGCGITLSWGCARQAARLAREAVGRYPSAL